MNLLPGISRRFALALALGLSGCSGQPSGPTGTTLEVTYTSPFQDDGALLFTITGGSVDSVEAAPGYVVYSGRPAPNTLEVIVTGDLSSRTIGRLYVSDERLVSQYEVRMVQVAARGSCEPQTIRV